VSASFVVYQPATGEILRTGNCSPAALALQAGPGEAVMEGDADDRTDRVVDGQIVPKEG